MRVLILFAMSILMFSACKTTTNIILDAEFPYKKIVSGAVIKLKPRTYRLEQHVLIENKENITIEGNGAILIMQSLADDVVLIKNSKNITLKNFKATHIEPQGPTGCTGNVIHIENGADVTIEKCELNGCGIVGVAAYDIKNLKLLNNHIHKNSEYGIIYQGPSIEIIGNTFENNKKGNLYFSFNNTSWPPEDLINKDENKEGLKMSKNIFK